MIEYNCVRCPQCRWVMRTPISNKMTNIEESLRIHVDMTHKK
jgi:hypothetical protein